MRPLPSTLTSPLNKSTSLILSPVTSLRRKPLEYISSKSALLRAAKCGLCSAVSMRRSVSGSVKNLGRSFSFLGDGNSLNGFFSSFPWRTKYAVKLRSVAILRSTVLRLGLLSWIDAKKVRKLAGRKAFSRVSLRDAQNVANSASAAAYARTVRGEKFLFSSSVKNASIQSCI